MAAALGAWSLASTLIERRYSLRLRFRTSNRMNPAPPSATVAGSGTKAMINWGRKVTLDSSLVLYPTYWVLTSVGTFLIQPSFSVPVHQASTSVSTSLFKTYGFPPE